MISFRGSGAIHERAKAIQIALARKGKPMTLSAALRLAVEEGLTALERKHGRSR
jgi:hypothetical protein